MTTPIELDTVSPGQLITARGWLAMTGAIEDLRARAAGKTQREGDATGDEGSGQMRGIHTSNPLRKGYATKRNLA